jgi:ATP-dependent RNA helicase DeaD
LKQFSELPLRAELINAINKIGFITETEVQEQAIPVILSGKDVIVRAKTGTGKTAAFIVPIMQNMPHLNAVSAIIIVPTRELALQVSTFSESIGRQLRIRTTTVYGGASIGVQVSNLRHGANIVVGTPGRVIDLIERGELRLDNVKFVVLDEGDRMLDMGFIDDVDYIISKTPKEKQLMLFSATMPRDVIEIAQHHMKEDYVKISVGSEEEPIVSTIMHSYTFAKGRMKFAALFAYIGQFSPRKCIIFLRTKHESELVHDMLVKQGFDAALMHGGLTQAMREHSLHGFKTGTRFLIATNIAARGLDIADVTDIINFDAPDSPEDYLHRVGRSARMGKEGRAFTILGLDEKGLLRALQSSANITMKELHLDLEKYSNFEMPEHRRHYFRGNEQSAGRYGQGREGGRARRGYSRRGFGSRNRF